MNYKLKIELAKGDSTKQAIITIWVQDWLNQADITDFKLIDDVSINYKKGKEDDRIGDTNSNMPGGYVTIDFNAQNDAT